MNSGKDKWRLTAKWLRTSGFVWCVACFLAELALIGFYSQKRPEVRRPDQGLTVSLSWTHPVRYGTDQDEKRLQLCFDLFFVGFGFIALAESIMVYKLKDYSGIRSRPKLPWNHRWGP